MSPGLDELAAKILSILMFHNRPLTSEAITELVKTHGKPTVHKALVSLRKADKIQFISKRLGWAVKK